MKRTLLLTLAVALLIIIPFCIWGETIDLWFKEMASADATTRSLLGSILFLALSLDIFFPIPSSLVSTLCGAFFGWVGGLLISTVAMSMSCIIGWSVGRLCTPLALRLIGTDEYPRLQRLLQRHGIVILLALRTVPVLAEASVLLAGIANVPFRKCMPLLLIANLLVSLIYVYAGVYGHNSENMLPAFLGSILLSALFMLGTTTLRKRSA
jgi:uncharacterized membrane protein YdjX (TVP38/TMEM64 family)